MSSSKAYHTGLHDRRGFDTILQILLGALVLSILILILYSWKLGLGMFLFFGIYYITFESISAPPENRPERFIVWARHRPRRRPVLLCLGDSLTHGNLSASITPEIPIKLSTSLGMDPPAFGAAFNDPLWIVNAGQVRDMAVDSILFVACAFVSSFPPLFRNRTVSRRTPFSTSASIKPLVATQTSSFCGSGRTT